MRRTVNAAVGAGGARPDRADFCETCGAAAIDERASIMVDVFADREHFDTIDPEGLGSRRHATCAPSGSTVTW